MASRSLLFKAAGYNEYPIHEASLPGQVTKAYPYDVALSYAGEDRKYAQELADILRSRGLKVFYDQYEKPILWGKDLYTHLFDVYQSKAFYCVIFISQHYANKIWTKHELEAAQARALRDNKEYILPLRLDDTDIPGILPTISYLNWREETAETIADTIMIKLHMETFSPYKPKGKRILVVDGEPPIQRVLQRNLTVSGYKVLIADNGKQAVEIVRVHQPDLILLELRLPGEIDGLEVCMRVRQLTHRPIIVVSGLFDERQKVQALDLGADDYLTKPFYAEELLARIRAVLRRTINPR